MKKALIILFVICNTITFSQINRIIINGTFSDWNNVPVLVQDLGDANSGMDLNSLSVFNDEQYLFVSINLGNTINLQNDNQLTLYIDADNNPNTGISYEGIGAELKFVFGNRRGQISLNGNTISVTHSDFGFFSSPTVTSNRFEFAIDRLTKINGVSLFDNSTIKIILKDFSGGDQIPNSSDGVEYTFENNNLEQLPDFSISKYSSVSIRVASYNVLQDGLFAANKEEYFSRLLSAINPEIIGFEEISQHNAAETANRMEQLLPSSVDQNWFTGQSNYDLILASRYNIIQSKDITTTTGSKRSAAFLLNLRPKFDTDFLVVLSHPKCCGGEQNDSKRQAQVDAIMAFIRDAKNGVGDFTVAQNTPFVIIGDMNFVGSNRQPMTIISGDILDNSNYGTDFSPDWDGSILEDAVPTTTNSPLTFTWSGSDSSFPPGRLDYLFYSGSVLNLKNSFSLFTPFIDSAVLAQYNLQPNDVLNASDHNPVVADFEFVGVTGIGLLNDNLPKEFKLYQNYPNPFNPTTTIEYTIVSAENRNLPTVQLKVFDIFGRNVVTLVNEKQSTGNYKVNFGASNIPSGIYYFRLSTTEGSNRFSKTRKMMVLK